MICKDCGSDQIVLENEKPVCKNCGVYIKEEEKKMRKPLSKPDYHFIQSHSCKEFVTVVRRLIMHERLFTLRDVRHINQSGVLDVALFAKNKLWIVRHFKGTTKAVMQAFPLHTLGMFTDEEKPNIDEFLKGYDEGEGNIDLGLWFPKIS